MAGLLVPPRTQLRLRRTALTLAGVLFLASIGYGVVDAVRVAHKAAPAPAVPPPSNQGLLQVLNLHVTEEGVSVQGQEEEETGESRPIDVPSNAIDIRVRNTAPQVSAVTDVELLLEERGQ